MLPIFFAFCTGRSEALKANGCPPVPNPDMEVFPEGEEEPARKLRSEETLRLYGCAGASPSAGHP
jgi:hypothetical protein